VPGQNEHETFPTKKDTIWPNPAPNGRNEGGGALKTISGIFVAYGAPPSGALEGRNNQLVGSKGRCRFAFTVCLLYRIYLFPLPRESTGKGQGAEMGVVVVPIAAQHPLPTKPFSGHSKLRIIWGVTLHKSKGKGTARCVASHALPATARAPCSDNARGRVSVPTIALLARFSWYSYLPGASLELGVGCRTALISDIDMRIVPVPVGIQPRGGGDTAHVSTR
jgi:hypothetical protein